MSDTDTVISTTTQIDAMSTLLPGAAAMPWTPQAAWQKNEDALRTENMMLHQKLQQQMEEKMELMQQKIHDLEHKCTQNAKVTVVLSHSQRQGTQVCLVANKDSEAQSRVQRVRAFINKNDKLLRQRGITMSIHDEVPLNLYHHTPEGSIF